MTGTFGGALEARQIPAGEGFLSSETTGEIEKDGNVLVIRRIHVTYHLRLHSDQRAAAERAHAVHADNCPVYRTIRSCVDVTTLLEMEDIATTSDDAQA
ncbi:MAG: OsmC family protein [Chloroflexi bacterium]|nr:OsmC family protein [Chloroflexota bacterium]